MKRLCAILALAAALALPASTLAATGTTSESGVSVLATISMTVPASVVYSGGPIWTTSVAVTGVSTNTAAGGTVTMTTSNLVSGGNTILTTKRAMGTPTQGGNWNAGAAHAAGYFASTATSAVILTTTDQGLSVSSATFNMTVDATGAAVGSYTGTLTFTAVAN